MIEKRNICLCCLGTTMDDSDSKTYSVGKRHIMVVNMLQNWNHRYSSHSLNIKALNRLFILLT